MALVVTATDPSTVTIKLKEPYGLVLEGPTWSFFWVRDGVLLTPPTTDG